LVVRNIVVVEVDDLLPAQRLLVSNVFEIYLHHLEGLCLIPINELPLLLAMTRKPCSPGEQPLVATQYVADGRGRNAKPFILR